LVCSTKFNCPAWLNAFRGSAAQVRQWVDGATSTIELHCNPLAKDIGLQIGDLYRAGTRVENGNFTEWRCLDYREVIVGGTPGSPHAPLPDGGDVGPKPKHKKLSKGAIAGIVITVLIVVAAIAVVLFLILRKKKGHHDGYQPTDAP
jgi:hypothetical protein